MEASDPMRLTKQLKGVTPIAAAINPATLGGAVLLTSACEDLEGDETNPDIIVPGGIYHFESRAMYHEQSLLGADLIEQALEECGVPLARIQRMHFHQVDGSPTDIVRRFIGRLPPHCPDCLIYYCGPASESGGWLLSWLNESGDLIQDHVDPESILPPGGEKQGPPGNRYIIADAPGTAQMWLRPATRLKGVAAWLGRAAPGGPGGPPLARWLSGQSPTPPEGIVAFPEAPPNTGLIRLPVYEQLFWGPSTAHKAETAGQHLWEVQEFVGATTQRDYRDIANYELLVRGGPVLLNEMLQLVGDKADDSLLLQMLWLLHNLVSYTPTARWVGAMVESMTLALAIPGSRQPECGSAVLTSVLSFAAACAGACKLCLAELSGDSWPVAERLVLAALAGSSAETAIAGCHLACQVARHRSLEETEHDGLLGALRGALLGQWEASKLDEVRGATAEVLILVCLRSNLLKLKVLAAMGEAFGALREVLEGASAAGCARLLALLRSLVVSDPFAEVIAHLPQPVVGSIVHCLCKHADHGEVQRWGLATLGTLVKADDGYAKAASEGGATCVLWALGADALIGAHMVEQEALFCGNSLVKADCFDLGKGQGAQLAGLGASAIARGLRRPSPDAEVITWGLRLLEAVAGRKGGVRLTEPYAGVITDAMLAPGCTLPAAVAGAGAVAYLAAASPVAKKRFRARRVALVKSLQEHRTAAASGPDGRARQQEMQDWVQVLVELFGDKQPPNADDEDMEDEEEDEQEEEHNEFIPDPLSP